jgi:hypothetical protein
MNGMADEGPKDVAASNGKGKGKGKASHDEMSDGAKALQAEPSLAARVASSASGLLRDTVGSSNGHAPGLIASSTTLGSKAQSSGPSFNPTSFVETGAVRAGRPADGSLASSQEAGKASSFRTPQSQSSAAAEFEQFVSRPLGPFDSSAQMQHSYSQPINLSDNIQSYSATSMQIDDGAEVRDLLSDSAYDFAFNDNFIKPDDHEPSGVSQAYSTASQLDDGAEVRNLLSDPTIEFEFDDSLNDFSTSEPGIAANRHRTPVYSELELEIITAMKSDLPPPPTHKDVPINHPLNLRPLSDVEQESLPQQIREYEEALVSRGQSLATLPAEDERELWLSDWEDVLNGYSDQVWGNILPDVKAAKSELEDVRAGSASLDSKTIARLKMILGHVHEHAGPPTPDSIFLPQRASKHGGD